MDGESICKLITKYSVDMTAAVPTVIAGMLQYCEQKDISLRGVLKLVCIGGAACPPIMMQTLMDKHGIDVRHLWGRVSSNHSTFGHRLTYEAVDLSYYRLVATGSHLQH